jgi:hypothetical protein
MDEFRVRLVPGPWNKGKPVGHKTPLKLKEIRAIRVRLRVFGRMRELALFDLGIDSKPRACDLLKLKVRDVCHERIAVRAIVMQQDRCNSRSLSLRGRLWPTGSDCPVSCDDLLFPSRVRASPHLSTRQYARIADSWVEEVGLDPAATETVPSAAQSHP